MATIYPGFNLTVPLAAGQMLSIAASADGTGLILRDGQADPARRKLLAGATKLLGPFPTQRSYSIMCLTGSIEVLSPTAPQRDHHFNSDLSNIEGFTGDLTLQPDDTGRVFRCDDSSNVIINVPSSLPLGFNCSVMRWGTGTVTFSAGSGMTKRSSTSAVSAQYKAGAVVVAKAGEFILTGDVA